MASMAHDPPRGAQDNGLWQARGGRLPAGSGSWRDRPADPEGAPSAPEGAPSAPAGPGDRPPLDAPSGGHARIHTKISFGIILTRINPQTLRPEAVLERGRYSYEYSEFIHGRYARKNTRMIMALVGAMTAEERLDIYSLDFGHMWYRIWLTAERRELYHKKLAKFQAAWMRDDGGEYLRRLVLGSAGDEVATPAPPRWEFPKGRRQSNREADINCAIREFEEEAGIPKRDYQLLPGIKRRVSYVHMGVRYVNVYYVAIARRDLVVGVNLRHLDQAAEVAEVRWLDIEQIRLLDTPSRRLEATAAPVFRYAKRYVRGLIPSRGLTFSLTPSSEEGESFDVSAHLDRLRAGRRPGRDLGRREGRAVGVLPAPPPPAAADRRPPGELDARRQKQRGRWPAPPPGHKNPRAGGR